MPSSSATAVSLRGSPTLTVLCVLPSTLTVSRLLFSVSATTSRARVVPEDHAVVKDVVGLQRSVYFLGFAVGGKGPHDFLVAKILRHLDPEDVPISSGK